MLALRLAILALATTAPAQDPEFVPGTHVPPAVGEVAKPLETVYWYYEGPDGRVPAIADLRGQVVLVHTWGYYCGPCMKEGVPYVVDLIRANADRGLTALSISVQVGDGKPDDHFVTVGREMGMDHPLGLADGYGGMTPYMNMNVSKGLTWCFVIGREGGVRWAGDPSIDGEELLDAVRDALADERLPALREGGGEPLAKAVAAYVAGDLERARSEAAKVESKLARKKASAEVDRAREYAGELVRAIDGHRAALEEGLAEALAARDAERLAADRELLLRRFGKSARKQVKELDRAIGADPELERAVALHAAWRELRDARPALFPVREDKAARKYAKALEKYVGGGDELPGAAEAKALLAAYEAGS